MSFLFLPTIVCAQETLSVQVKEGEIRATPSFLGKIVARVAYGDRVSVVEKRGQWRKVSVGGGKVQGWMHTSALTNKRIALHAGETNVQTGATQNELALAGKGFNEQVETQFRKENKNLDYTWINRMETFKVSPDTMRGFFAQGDVVLPSEGVRP
jgi:SH3-like domain-containing protein